MALIEYNIDYDDNTETSTVTLRVVEVNEGDRIRFTSNYEETGIRYTDDSPFDDQASGVPHSQTAFYIGNGTKGPFTVTKQLGRKLHFDCGEGQLVRDALSGQETFTMTKTWGSGAATPD